MFKGDIFFEPETPVLPANNEDIENIQITVLLEAVYQRYGFDFRHYAHASIKRRIRNTAAGVILSGAGHDGAAGLAAIKPRGGLTLVQSPSSAQSSYMPDAAIATGQVDKVLPVEEIVPFLSKWQHT